MWEKIKKFFEREKYVYYIDDYKIMTVEEIIKEHKELKTMETTVRYLYTKVKELEKNKVIKE